MGQLIVALFVIGTFLMVDAEGSFDDSLKNHGCVGMILIVLGLILLLILF